ncbi:MAG: serpin family protein [Promethearchaeota archaeon]
MTKQNGRTDAQVTDNQILVHGLNAFTIDLYENLRRQEGNLFFSPLSISTALAMTYAGADGRTATQMAEVLHFALEQEKLHPAFKTLNKLLLDRENISDYSIITSNALWIQKDYALLPAFLDIIKKNYGESLFEVDYSEHEFVMKRINEWVRDKTQQKITELISKGILNEATRLVLTNAIYFKGNWQFQFKEADTRTEQFNLATGNEVMVPMMHQTRRFGFMEKSDFQALELPYAGDDLSIIILLPKEEQELTELENSLTIENLAKWFVDIHEQDVEVFMPRFKMSAQFNLKNVLREMGMLDAFSSKDANFSRMTGSLDLQISGVIHKAYVDVNEEGTEAAAATAVVMVPKGMARPVPIPVFRADRPFLFFIRNIKTNCILFIGRVMNPKE